MRRMYLLSAFILPALLMGVSLIALTPQAPPPPDLPHPDGVFSPAYVEADRLLEASWLPGNAGQKEALLLKAAERFTEAIHEAPDNASTYVNRGNIYAQLGQYDLAIADYNAALRITPWAGSADVIKNRGLVYEEQGQLCEALADFETFLSMIRDAPTERRASERVQFAAKVQVLRSQLSASEEQSLCPPQTSQSSLQSASEPETWVLSPPTPDLPYKGEGNSPFSGWGGAGRGWRDRACLAPPSQAGPRASANARAFTCRTSARMSRALC